MHEIEGVLLVAFLVLVWAVSILTHGANDVPPREIQAAYAVCENNGGLNHIDNDYFREVVCENGVRISLHGAVKLNATP